VYKITVSEGLLSSLIEALQEVESGFSRMTVKEIEIVRVRGQTIHER